MDPRAEAPQPGEQPPLSPNLAWRLSGPPPAPLVRIFLDPPPRGREALVVALLAVLADLCLWDRAGGTGAALLLLVTVGALVSLAPERMRLPGRLLVLSLILSGASLVWNASNAAGFAAVLGTLALALKLRNPDWSIPELLSSIPGTLLRGPLRLIELATCVRRRLRGAQAADGGAEGGRAAGHISLRAVLVPLSITFLFLLIFIAANPVVERTWDRTWELLGAWGEPFFRNFSPARCFIWVAWLLLFAALVRPIFEPIIAPWLRQRQETIAPEPPEGRTDAYATALTTLVLVNALFLAFNLLDSVYLYFKAELPEGVSWAQYAQHGCAWLTVALLLSTVVLGAFFGPRLAFHPQARRLRWAAYLWGVQNLVLAAGALRRLQMYVDYNGLTYLRIVGLFGVLLVVAGLGIMLWKVARERSLLWILRRDLLAIWTTLVVLAVLPADYLCGRHNAAMVMKDNPRPLALLVLGRLSPESYPPLLILLDHPQPWVREGVAAFLGRRAEVLRKADTEPWTRTQGANLWARSRLEAVLGRIESIVPREGWAQAETAFFQRVSPWLHSRKKLSYD